MIQEIESDGLSISEIGCRLETDRKTVCQYLECDHVDFEAPRR